MSWARIDDGILDHPKFLDASEDALNLFLRGVIWCNRKLSDGKIPKPNLPQLSLKKDAPKSAAVLVQIGMWEDHGDHWMVHDYLEWNDSRTVVLERRRKERERMALVRANKPTNGRPNT